MNLFVLPLSAGNNGGENCDDRCEARWGGKNNGGVFLGALLPSSTGLNPPALKQEKNHLKYLLWI